MYKQISFLMVCLFALAACGGTSDSDSQDATAAVTLSRFMVEGTGPAENGVVPIDAAMNGGKLWFEWVTKSGNDYRVSLYLSKDDTLDTKEDPYILGLNCGPTYELFSGCGKEKRVQCVWDAENRLDCETELKPKTLTYWLDQLPQDAWALAQVCNSLFTQCSVYSVPVQLR